MGISRWKYAPLLLIAAFMAFVVGCGGDTETMTVTETDVVQAPMNPGPKKQKSPQPTPKQAHELRADCTVTVVASNKKPRGIQKAFFCEKSIPQARKVLPVSPFAAKDECRLDVEANSLYRGDYYDPVILSETWPRFSTQCKRIRFVVYALADENTLPYRREAPLTKGALEPGQKGYYNIFEE